MAEKPEMTLADYSRPSEIGSCIVLPPVDEDVSFEIDPSLICFIMKFYQFGGLPSEDPHMHLQYFLQICSTTKHQGLCEDGFRLRLFPFSLKDNAGRWFWSLPARSITTWDQLVTKFRARYFPPSRLMKMRDIETSAAYDLLDEMTSTDFQRQHDRPVVEKLLDVQATDINTELLKQVEALTNKVESLMTLVQNQQYLPPFHMNELCREVDYLSTNFH